MNKIAKIDSRFGYINVFTNSDESLLYAVPYGYIGPGLIKKDLKFMAVFDKNCNGQWTYIVDISNVKLANPINPFLLKRLKQFKKMKEYVVYAPNPFVRFVLRLANWLNEPDRVIKEYSSLQIELQHFKVR